MAVFRVQKTKDYIVMSNFHLRDRGMSLKAKGLLSLMLSLPDGWDFTLTGLASICQDGIGSVRSGISELEKRRYLIRRRIREINGQFAINFLKDKITSSLGTNIRIADGNYPENLSIPSLIINFIGNTSSPASVRIGAMAGSGRTVATSFTTVTFAGITFVPSLSPVGIVHNLFIKQLSQATFTSCIFECNSSNFNDISVAYNSNVFLYSCQFSGTRRNYMVKIAHGGIFETSSKCYVNDSTAVSEIINSFGCSVANIGNQIALQTGVVVTGKQYNVFDNSIIYTKANLPNTTIAGTTATGGIVN